MDVGAQPSATSDSVDFSDILDAAKRLSGHSYRTPTAVSRSLNALVGGELFFKCESLQRAGAFKFRGAYNALASLDAAARARGVLAYSSGNHAQAIALAGRELAIPATIIMPTDAPQVKLDATRAYGGEVILYDRATHSREELAVTVAAERGLTVIPPYNHPAIVAGQGTAGRELLEYTGALDLLLVPCGGGGLLSGCAIAAASMAPGCRVIGVEPAGADDAARSFRTGVLQTCDNPQTIADGARTPSLGTVTFPLVRRYVHDFVLVSDEQLIAGMRMVWERLKLVVEPTGALAAAAVLCGLVPVADKRVGIVLSGGNVELARAGEWFGTRD
ncbi:MAG TPA: threo-3-hydroxy-L-aspartate ammonia-lyase [Vicinamibacterales bacterium]|nr:threo-3-hydroxy-L-aspartate ammonia-lyase [Vicinamibacterales bacterium]